jgi:hypothetical protein
MKLAKIIAIGIASAVVGILAQCSSYDPGSWDRVALTVPSSETCIATCRLSLARTVLGDTATINAAARLGAISDTARVCIMSFRGCPIVTWPVANTDEFNRLTAKWDRAEIMTWHTRIHTIGNDAIVACPDQTWVLKDVSSAKDAQDVVTALLTQAAQGCIEYDVASMLFHTPLNDTVRALGIVNDDNHFYRATLSAYPEHIDLDISTVSTDGTTRPLSTSLTSLVDTTDTDLTASELQHMCKDNALTLAIGIKPGAMIDLANRFILPKMPVLQRAKITYALSALSAARAPMVLTIAADRPVLTLKVGSSNPTRLADRMRGLIKQAELDATVSSGDTWVAVSKPIEHDIFSRPDEIPEAHYGITALLATAVRMPERPTTITAVMTDSTLNVRCMTTPDKISSLLGSLSKSLNTNNSKH